MIALWVAKSTSLLPVSKNSLIHNLPAFSKNRTKTPRMYRLYHKTYASNKPQKYRGFTAKPMHNM
jgi:hypothetical protein